MAAISLAVLAACSEQGKTGNSSGQGKNPVTNAEQASFTPFRHLEAFNGKAPEELLVDKQIGQQLRTILPQEQISCTREIFNYLPDLELKPDGRIHAELGGSHAENWMHALLDVQPSGEINLLLDCSFEHKGEQPFYLFTNRDVDAHPARVVNDWIDYALLHGNEKVVVSNGSQKREGFLHALRKEENLKPAKNLADQKPSQSSQQAESSAHPRPNKETTTHDAPRVAQAGDLVAAYADELARTVEASGLMVCKIQANSIRMMANGNHPADIRIRRVDTVFDKTPSICF